LKIQIENNHSKIRIDRRTIRGFLIRLMKCTDCTDKEISISFVDDPAIRHLNFTYLAKNKPTNVLSFPLQEGEFNNINPQMLGDIVISVDTAARDAKKGHLTLIQEINFLIIHGFLHLMGYNHENTTADNTTKMQQKEKELFRKLTGYKII
jgi:probable rRNA maturation factor